MAASVLKSIGIPELVTETTEAYIALAIELSKNLRKHQDIVDMLTKLHATAEIFNTEVFKKQFEDALLSVYTRYHETGNQ